VSRLVIYGICLWVVAMTGFGTIVWAESETSWSVRGAGFFQNRILSRQLQTILFEDDKLLTSADIEDASFILLSLMQQQGFLDAKLRTRFRGSEETEITELFWDRSFETYLPEQFTVSQIEFKLKPGPFFYYGKPEVTDSGGMTPKEIESFFYQNPLLFRGKAVKLFTPGGFEKSVGNLESYLRQQGFQDVTVEGTILHQDWSTGEVIVRISINKGPLHILKQIQWENEHPLKEQIDLNAWLDQPFSREIRQDIIRVIRNLYYEKGYPDVKIETQLDSLPTSDGVENTLKISIVSGSQKLIRNIAIDGLKATKRDFVNSRMLLKQGDYLNPILLDRSRMSLSKTGIFDKVNVDIEPVSDLESDLLFSVSERFPWALDVFVGWGTYEMLRAGFEVERDNLWGVGQQIRFKSILSMKSLFGETRYLIPDVWNSGASVSMRAFALNREEIAFDRKEQGVDVGVSRHFEKSDLDAALVYTLEMLESADRQLRTDVGNESVRAGSVALRLSRDSRDSPIHPQNGYRVYGNAEWASTLFGGEVAYQLEEIGFAYHRELGSGLYWHFGFSSGLVTSQENAEGFIPDNKLYFPGGDNSIRGYERGEAALRDDEGFYVGARASSTANMEFEQYLTQNFSLVAFYDWSGNSIRSRPFSFDDSLSSIGIGIRFRTIMGPLRLEYGHNLNRRPGDPSGTLQFALGYPF
jgi:outer membrane protein insertion porin family